MTITRIGSTERYAENWAHAFGVKRTPAASKSAKTTAVKNKKTTSKNKSGRKSKAKKR